jgi:hypothetical protein
VVEEGRGEFKVKLKKLLEKAHIASRYLPREYAREEAEALVNLASEV